MYSLLLRSCRRMGAFLISPLPPLLNQTLICSKAPSLHRHTPLLRYHGPGRRRLAFHRFPAFDGYTIYLAPSISRWDEDGFTSCLACPCHRATPTTPPKCKIASVSCDLTCSLRPTIEGSAFGIFLSRPPLGSLSLW